MSIMKQFMLLALVSGGVLLSGCLGPLYGIYEVTKEEPQKKAAPVFAVPVVNVDAKGRELDPANVSIDFELSDGDGHDCDVLISYRVGAGAWNPCTNITGAVTSLSAPAASQATHSVTWDATADLAGDLPLAVDVDIQVIASDVLDTSWASTSGPFLCGNELPDANVPTPGSSITLNGVVNYSLLDSTSDNCGIVIEYSPDSGSNYYAATIVSGETTSLTSSPGGEPHNFVWDSLTDIGAVLNSNVRVRVTPTDSQAGTPGETGDFTVMNTSALPIISIAQVDRALASPQTVNYVLYDSDANPCTITLEYSLNSGGAWSAGTATGGDGTGPLASSATGAPHTIDWDYAADGVSTFYNNTVMVRIIPDDGNAGVAGESNTFTVGNELVAAAVTTPVGVQNGNVVIAYDLTDSTSDATGIAINYSPDNGANYYAATIASGDMTGLTSSPGGMPHTFVWDSLADIGALNSGNTVRIQVIPTDSELGTSDATVSFTVNNTSELPIANISTVGRALGSPHVFNYVIYDSDSDPCSISLQYSLNSGGVWAAATAIGGDGTTGLSTSPTGGPHTIGWDYAADGIVAFYNNTVMVRVVPDDGDTGTAGDSNTFTLGNQIPVAAVTTPGTEVNGNVVIAYDLTDSTSDATSIVINYSPDGGSNYYAATIVSGETSALTSSPGGTGHTFVWDSLTDIGALNNAAVRIQVIPTDSQLGTLDATGDFTVNNTSALPIVNISTVGRALSSAHAINYILYDSNSDTCSISMEYSLDSGGNWFGATATGGNGTSGLSSSPTGAPLLINWNYAADGVAAFYNNTVMVRITPTDGSGGISGESNTFTVGNQLVSAGVVNPVGTQSGNIVITYTLTDSTSDATSIAIKYSPDSGSNYYDATIASGDTAGLTSSPGGALHTFVWDSLTDLSAVNNSTVRIQVIPTDSELGTAGNTIDFTVNNTAELPIVNVDTVGRALVSPHLFSYLLYDSNSDLCTISMEYSVNSGGNWFPATAVGGDGTGPLASSPTGTSHTIGWNYIADGVVTFYDNTVMVRVTPNDGIDGTPGTSNTFILGNELAVAAVATPGGIQSGNVVIAYTLTDSTSDSCDIAVAYSDDGGGSWNAATIVSGGETGLASSPGGTPHTITWDSSDLDDGDGDGVRNDIVQIRITPTDSQAGTPGASGDFTVNNNTVPSVTYLGSASILNDVYGIISIPYQITDAEDDPCSIVLEYSKNSGAWNTCTEYPARMSDGTTGLSSTAAGTRHLFLWNCLDDTGFEDSVCDLRITVLDQYGNSSGTVYKTIEVSNRTAGWLRDEEYHRLSTTNEPSRMAYGDFNGDDYPDAVATCRVSDDALIMYGSAAGLKSPISVSVADLPGEVATGDFNGDGFDDFVCLHFNIYKMTLYLGGPESMTYGGEFSFAHRPIALDVTDLNGDGLDDVTVCLYQIDTIDILYGNSVSGFDAGISLLDAEIDNPYDVTVGNFDGDAYEDVAIACYTSARIVFIWGSAAKTHAMTSVVAMASSRSITTGNFNGDAYPDVAVAAYITGGNNIVFVHGGPVRAALAQTYLTTTSNRPLKIAAGDVNGDGYDEMVCANSPTTDQLLISYGSSAGCTVPEYLVAGDGLTLLTVPDLNGDGFGDIVCLSGATDEFIVSYGSGAGHGPAQLVANRLNSAPAGLTAADFNGDGFDDFAGACQGVDDIVVVYGSANGHAAPDSFTFAAGGTSVVELTTGDFNGDGFRDNAAIDGSNDLLVVGYGSASGIMSYASFGTEIYPWKLTRTDLNGDGIDDVAVVNYNAATIQVAYGSPAGLLVLESIPGPAFPDQIASGDINNDGFEDIICPDGEGSDLMIIYGSIAGHTASQLLGVGSLPHGVGLADMNDDTYDDIVCVSSDGFDIRISFGGPGGHGTVAPDLVTIPMSAGGERVAFGDINDDGCADAVMSLKNADRLAICYGDPVKTNIVAVQEIAVGSNPEPVGLGDLNNDGFDDIVGANFDNPGSISISYGSAGGHGAVTTIAVGSFPRDLAVGDINADGFADIVTANRDTDDISIVYGRPGADPTDLLSSEFIPSGDVPYSVRLGDFNADGFRDIACGSGGDHAIQLLYGRDIGLARRGVVGTVDAVASADSHYVLGKTRIDFQSGTFAALQSLDLRIRPADIRIPVGGQRPIPVSFPWQIGRSDVALGASATLSLPFASEISGTRLAWGTFSLYRSHWGPDRLSPLDDIPAALQATSSGTLLIDPLTRTATTTGAGDLSALGTYQVFMNVDDTDNDGMADDFEIEYFTLIGNRDGTLDFDGDGLTDLQEYENECDPTVADTDGDGIADGNEVGQGGDPTNPAYALTDTDTDTMPDYWEQCWFGNLAQTAATNSDGDLLLDIVEYLIGTDPTSSDTPDVDGDGLADTWEQFYFGNLTQNNVGNPDADGRTNLNEQGEGTDPTRGDTDGDGINDLNEFLGGTNPRLMDTDGDLYRDGIDGWPLNPGLW